MRIARLQRLLINDLWKRVGIQTDQNIGKSWIIGCKDAYRIGTIMIQTVNL